MQLTICDFIDAKPCDNCEKEGGVFHVRCASGTLDADLCAKCLARQCRLRAKAKQTTDSKNANATNGGAA